MKVIKDLAMFLMVALMSAALAACGDDPKNEPANPNDDGNGDGGDDGTPGMSIGSIVGSWELRDEQGSTVISWTWTFNANGTFETMMQEETSSTILNDTEGSYSCEGNVLTMIYINEDGQQQVDTFEYNIIGNSLVVTDTEGAMYIFTRIDGGQQPSNSLVGAWEGTEHDGSLTLYEKYVFNADGSFRYYGCDTNSQGEVIYTDNDGGRYTVNGNTLTLEWNGGDVDSDISFMISGNNLMMDGSIYTRTSDTSIPGEGSGGDTPDDPVVTISLVGSWEFFEINYYEVITFNDDGTFMWYVRDYIDTYIDYGTYRNTSDRIMLDWNDEDGAEEVAYSVDGNTLSIWDPADPSDVQVYTKTNSPDIRSSGNGQLR